MKSNKSLGNETTAEKSGLMNAFAAIYWALARFGEGLVYFVHLIDHDSKTAAKMAEKDTPECGKALIGGLAAAIAVTTAVEAIHPSLPQKVEPANNVPPKEPANIYTLNAAESAELQKRLEKSPEFERKLLEQLRAQQEQASPTPGK